ncbi:hypothetical protein [Perigonia lusca single nucleopolyhedrovirus]|uniref:Uncharacterized protein n=1 Tax=Perigonia lusca single nucleopolyhedrovirus TaxID=1675865 RepID=A0A0M3WP56_9ABAC|nr:hypothetical protein [Perigonia lusca single nucleopolyhedrovirus]AKN80576.1 hypothetical protein [Perigonia lusca single nucleopolyhedrovirus]
MSSTSVSQSEEDIFDVKNVMLITYDTFHSLKRYKLIELNVSNQLYKYYDTHTNKIVITPRKLKTLDAIQKNLIVVY